MEEKAEARKCFETAAEIWEWSEQRGSPTHARILYNLVFVVEPRRGSDLLREAIRYDPNCKEFKMGLQMLLPSKCVNPINRIKLEMPLRLCDMLRAVY